MLFRLNNKRNLKNYLLLLLLFSFALGSEQNSINSKIYFDFTRQEDGSNEFGIKRAYFTYKKNMSSDLSFTFQTDVDYQETTSPKNIYLKKANVSWKNQFGRFSIGLIGMNMFNIHEKTWGNRFISKTAMDKNKYSSSADFGIGIAKNISTSWYINGMVTNGSGYKNSENDKYKKLSLQLVSGQKNLSKNEGINFGTVFSHEPFHEDSVSTVIGVFSGYHKNSLRAGIEYNALKNRAKKTLASGYINWQKNSSISVYCRYDLHTIKSDIDSYMILGFGYTPGSGLIIAPNIRIKKENDESSTDFVINFQFSF